jgi:hypothetical protein
MTGFQPTTSDAEASPPFVEKALQHAFYCCWTCFYLFARFLLTVTDFDRSVLVP